jgi:hypothetical protein
MQLLKNVNAILPRWAAQIVDHGEMDYFGVTNQQPVPYAYPAPAPSQQVVLVCIHATHNKIQDAQNPHTCLISEVNDHSYVQCHWCLSNNWTEVVHSRGWASW